MRYKTIRMYLIILCIIVSISNSNESIIHTQLIQEPYNHNQVENYQIIHTNHSSLTIYKQSYDKPFNNQLVQKMPKLLTTTSVTTELSSTGFISIWQTNLTSVTSSNSNQIRLPLVSSGTYNFVVYWGDGSSNLITTYNQKAITHTYNAPGTYVVDIVGTIVGWSFDGSGDAVKLIQIANWGPLRLGNTGNYFSEASNLILTTKKALDLNGTTDLAGMFEFCNSIGNSGDLNSWNVSQITDMSHMFYYASLNQSLDSWNVSQVTDMSYMFAYSFFNNPLDAWDVSHVTNMSYMFDDSFFNQPLDAWNVSKVTDMNHMFENSNLDQPLNSWNVSQVTNMNHMFFNSVDFNQPLNSWNVSKVTDMRGMFDNAFIFNQPLNSWNVSKVNSMVNMFGFASSFNQPLDSWNVSQVTDMSGMFTFASNFNQPLNSWNVSQVTDMYIMFDTAIHFNQPINSWDVSKVTNMRGMFSGATSFNQPLNFWNVSQVNDMSNLFSGDSLSVSNYDSLLLGWSNLPDLQHNITFDAGHSQYNASAQNARGILIKNFGWTISDGGLALSETVTFKSLFTLVVIIIAFVSFIGFSVYGLTIYFEYKKINNEEYNKELKFLNYLKNRGFYKIKAKEKLNSENIFCSQCGKISSPQDVFCQNCGSKL